MPRKAFRAIRRHLGRPQPSRIRIGWGPFAFFIGLTVLAAAIGNIINRMVD